MLPILLLLAAAGLASERASLVGRPLAEVLAELQQGGLGLVFSTALVRPEMKVVAEPRSADPRAVLEEILAPHGLELRDGGGGQLVVVRAATPSPTGTIRGVLRAEGGERLLRTARVRVLGTAFEAPADATGRFEVLGVPAGEHVLEVTSQAFLPQRVEGVRVRPGATTRVAFDLVPASAFLEEIVVTPSHFRILGAEPESRQFLTREEVDRMPHVADDLFRAVKRLPGTASGDVSARFSVRGGEPDEVLVMLDGMELYEPFHLKDFQSIFSIVDAEAVGAVDFLTGGFPVEYGDRMSGVMDITVATPTGPAATTVGVGTLNSRVVSEGALDRGRGSWLVSARAWYPDALLDLTGSVDETLRTDYADLLVKLEHGVGTRSGLSLNLVSSDDTVELGTADEEGFERTRSDDSSHHLWLTLTTQWDPAVASRTVLSGAQIWRHRVGALADVEDGALAISDRREFEVVGLRQDWTAELGDRHLLKAGFDLRRQAARYDYLREIEALEDGGLGGEDARVELAPKGWSYAAYAADRLRLTRQLVAEVGLRWDRQTWIDEDQLSPRLNLRWEATPRTTVRASWGRFHQSERLNELQVEDGVTSFGPAQLAMHLLASLEHRLPNGIAMRAELYDKQLDHLRPRYENLLEPFELFPEARSDRVLVAPEEGRARGVELLLRRSTGEPLSWWISYAFGRAEDRLDGEWVPRGWDQRHAVSFGLNLELGRGWNLNLAGTAHSGWPITGASAVAVGGDPEEPELEIVYGPRNGERLPGYRRLDLRCSKVWPTRRGEVTLILEVVNLTNRANPCCVTDESAELGADGEPEVVREYGTWAPMVPSVGVRWSF